MSANPKPATVPTGGPQEPGPGRRTNLPIDRAAQHYAAIIESSDDAILSKDLNGVILSWNYGAERLFGYTPEEAIGQPVVMLIPPDRHNEEPRILEQIRRGESVQHYETVRQRKDGMLIDISLTVSPIRDAEGRVVGASKIARDITELKRTRDQQRLLLREMSHRVKNLFALSSSIIGLSARSAKSTQELAEVARERLSALARAHSLTFSHADPTPATTLLALIGTLVEPFEERGESRIAVHGIDPVVAGAGITSVALLVHEFATNATKYGALSTPSGAVDVACSEEDAMVVIRWTERGGPPIAGPRASEGFGGVLSRFAVTNQLGGSLDRDWRPEGLAIRLAIPRERLAG
jgi:PAS domain S-box-containing protein